MNTIFLTGFMGAGKTTIGKLLAKKLGWAVTDTDDRIEKQTAITISTIFAEKGEAYFRDLETEVLLSCGAKEGIVTTGGGIIEREENRRLMKEKGMVLFLEADFSILWERLKVDTERPLIQEKNKEKARQLYERRLPIYQQSADVTIVTAGKSVEETVDEIISRLKLQENGKADTVK